MKIIPIENIMSNGNNRKNAGELTLIPSIKTDGILEPIIVYKEKGDEKFRIAAGHRRYASAKAYGIEDIPCIVLPEEKAIRAACIENIDRENLSPADLAESILSMSMDCGYCVDDIAAVTRLSKNQVARILRLKNCIPEVQEALKEGKFTLEIALEYAPYSEDIQKAVYKDYHKSTWSKAKDIREALNRRVGTPLNRCSDTFINSTLGCGCSCLSCEHNLACDGVLFAEGTTKEESVCKDTSLRLKKYTELAKSLDLPYIWVKEMEEYGYPKISTGYVHGTEEPQNYKGCTKALNENGEVVYVGGTYVSPPLQQRVMSDKEKELRELLQKEKEWLKDLLKSAEKKIRNKMYGEVAEALCKCIEPYNNTVRDGFVTLVEDQLYSEDGEETDLREMVKLAFFNYFPGKISQYNLMCALENGENPRKALSRYLDVMKDVEYADDIRKLIITAENICDFKKQIEEMEKDGKQ